MTWLFFLLTLCSFLATGPLLGQDKPPLQNGDMTMYEWSSLVVGILTLGVLSCTLCVLKKYADDTKIIAKTSVEQLPRPCLVLKRSADASPETVIAKDTTKLCDLFLIFVKVGTGPAVNCLYSSRDTGETEKGEPSCRQLPEIGPSDCCVSEIPRNTLPKNSVVSIAYESIAGSPYRTEITIKDEKWVMKTIFCPKGLGRLKT